MSLLVPPEHGPARRQVGVAPPAPPSAVAASRDDESRLLRLAQAYLTTRRLGVAGGPALSAAWESFHAGLDPTIRAMAWACRCPAPELGDGVQEVWFVLVRRLPDYRHDPARGRFRDWLFVVTRRTLANLGRGRRAHETARLAASSALAGREADPAAAAERSERAGLVRAALAATDDPSAADAARLYWAEGRAAREVAAELGLTEGRLWALLRRARRELAARLAAAGCPGDS